MILLICVNLLNFYTTMYCKVFVFAIVLQRQSIITWEKLPFPLKERAYEYRKRKVADAQGYVGI